MELLSLLFMSSCFLTLSGLTFGDQSESISKVLNIPEGPVIVKEGDDAILPCSFGTSIVHVRFEWTKEGTKEKVYICDTGVGYSPALPDRVSHFRDDLQHGNASIKIDNVQLKDGGIYTCDFPTSGKTFRIKLVVEKHVIVKEGDDAILPCSLGTSIVHVRFEWTKEGTEKEVYIHDTGVGNSPALGDRVSHFRGDLKNGNASIKIKNVQLEDGGIYTCDFPTRGKTFWIELVVGAAEPEITSRDQINGGVLLQCDVKNAHPKPTVEWWDSNDQIIHSEQPQVSEQGGRFNITLKANVKKTGRYRCVATQEEINHQTQKEINVHIYGAAEPEITSRDQINGGMLLQCDVKNAHPKPTVEWWDSNDQIIPSEEPQVSKQGGHFNITLKATVKKTGRYRCVATQEEINQQAQKEINVHIYEKSDSAQEPWKIVAIVLVVVLALAAFWILLKRYIKNKKKTNKESSEPSAQEQKLNAEQSV